MAELTEYPGAPDIESSTPDYQKRFSGKVGGWFLDVQNKATRAVLSKIDNSSSLDIADIGGGHGQNVGVITESGHHLTVIGSDESCKQLILPFVDQGKIDFELGDLLSLSFEDRSFDVVLSYRMLAHLQDWKQHISELTRISDNLVIVDFPTIRSVNYFSGSLFGLKNKVEKNTRYYKLFSEQEVVDEFERNGFAPLCRVGQFFFPMALHRAIKIKSISAMLEAVPRFIGLSRYFSSPLIYGFVRKEQE
jgi:2-polyprenyl-3-methyl-5-hydroxy-6-metoxy-1,4-benzoquinol methylase